MNDTLVLLLLSELTTWRVIPCCGCIVWISISCGCCRSICLSKWITCRSHSDCSWSCPLIHRINCPWNRCSRSSWCDDCCSNGSCRSSCHWISCRIQHDSACHRFCPRLKFSRSKHGVEDDSTKMYHSCDDEDSFPLCGSLFVLQCWYSRRFLPYISMRSSVKKGMMMMLVLVFRFVDEIESFGQKQESYTAIGKKNQCEKKSHTHKTKASHRNKCNVRYGRDRQRRRLDLETRRIPWIRNEHTMPTKELSFSAVKHKHERYQDEEHCKRLDDHMPYTLSREYLAFSCRLWNPYSGKHFILRVISWGFTLSLFEKCLVFSDTSSLETWDSRISRVLENIKRIWGERSITKSWL